MSLQIPFLKAGPRHKVFQRKTYKNYVFVRKPYFKKRFAFFVCVVEGIPLPCVVEGIPLPSNTIFEKIQSFCLVKQASMLCSHVPVFSFEFKACGLMLLKLLRFDFI